MLLPLCISHNERYEYKVNNEKKFEVSYFLGKQTNADFFHFDVSSISHNERYEYKVHNEKKLCALCILRSFV
ncbi:hypothetical protein BH11BAC5_BH11BAC5_44720 [soil metagenome]